MKRREFLLLAASTTVLPAASYEAWAQTYPTRPVRMIVPFGPGGGTDIVARLIGQWLTERLGQTFVIENRPGAGGNLGTEAVVRAPPDGYTLALIGAPSAINATLYDNLTFNFIRDIAPVAIIVRFPNLMVVNRIGSGQDRSRVHCLRQGQPGQAQHVVARERQHAPCCR